MATVGVRELRQNLSRYLEQVKSGAWLEVTGHGRIVGRLSQAGAYIPEDYGELAAGHGATIPDTS